MLPSPFSKIAAAASFLVEAGRRGAAWRFQSAVDRALTSAADAGAWNIARQAPHRTNGVLKQPRRWRPVSDNAGGQRGLFHVDVERRPRHRSCVGVGQQNLFDHFPYKFDQLLTELLTLE